MTANFLLRLKGMIDDSAYFIRNRVLTVDLESYNQPNKIVGKVQTSFKVLLLKVQIANAVIYYAFLKIKNVGKT